MDLETFLPLLLLAAAYLYRAFENAAKKNKKAGPAAPAEGQLPGNQPRREPVKDRPAAPGRAVTPGKPASPAWPARPQTSGVPRREPGGIPSRPAPSAPRRIESYPGGAPAAAPRSAPYPELPEEVLRAREVKRRATAPARTLAAPASPAGTRAPAVSGNNPLGGGARREAGEDEYAAAGFDLRDAVIKAAILERREF